MIKYGVIDTDKIRTIEVDGKTYYNGKDVAKLISNKSAIGSLITKIGHQYSYIDVNGKDTLGRRCSVLYINEEGVLRLLFGGKLKISNEFREWAIKKLLEIGTAN